MARETGCSISHVVLNHIKGLSLPLLSNRVSGKAGCPHESSREQLFLKVCASMHHILRIHSVLCYQLL